MLNPACPESAPGPGRWTAWPPAAVCPGIKPGAATAPRPAPGTLGGAGESASAGLPETCGTADPPNPDTRNTTA